VQGPILAHLFPRDAAQFARDADQIAESRLWAGIHFRSDIEGGKALGKMIADMVIDRMKGDS
jgi:hypothetical protein